MADDCALPLGFVDVREGVEKPAARVDRDELDPKVCAEGPFHLFALVQPEQAGIDEDAGELIAYRAVHEGGGDRRIDAAGQSADHLRPADGAPNFVDLTLDERARRPSRLGFADAEEKVRDELIAARRVRHFRVELNAVDRPLTVSHRRDRDTAARRGHDVVRGRSVDVIAMTHPYRHPLMLGEAVEESARLFDPQLRAPIFAAPGVDDLSAGQMRNELHAVADAEDRRDVEQLRVGAGRVFLVDRARTTAEDDSRGVPFANPIDRPRRRVDLRVHSGLAHAPRNELRELRPVIDDQNA